jgi:DNA/RNA endonuclease G (NUC1)
MVAAADLPNQDELDASFSIANASPQDPTLNRGWWRGLEAFERFMTIASADVQSCTGPLISNPDRATAISDKMVMKNGNTRSGIRVPESFFKCILAKKKAPFTGNELLGGCFFVKNEPMKSIGWV